jgi:alpha 1,3-glucosidase
MSLVLALILLLCVILSTATVMAVDRRQFRTCSETPFCSRFRSQPNGHCLKLTSFALNGGFEMAGNADDPPRKHAGRLQEIDQGTWELTVDVDLAAIPLLDEFILPLETKRSQIVQPVYGPQLPDRVDLVHNQKIVKMSQSGNIDIVSELTGLVDFGIESIYVEGAEGSVGATFRLPRKSALYGLAEHTDSLTLQNTRQENAIGETDPYRLFNADVFEYELGSRMALYGSVPFVIAHDAQRSQSVGLLWHNPSETWVDVDGLAGGESESDPRVTFLSAKGTIRVYLFLGPSIADVLRQYHRLTGAPQLPPLASLAYHQCRWNYDDEEDVRQVLDGFDHSDTPMDVLWLDIEHTDGKRYWTWHPDKFPKPLQLLADIQASGRHVVTIVDPHVKVDPNYFGYQQVAEQNVAVMTADGSAPFEGKCWPGQSVWVDYVNPNGRALWHRLVRDHALTPFLWNDMNEPSVFEQPEVTMPPNVLHYLLNSAQQSMPIAHSYVHNAYGALMHRSTFEGLLFKFDATAAITDASASIRDGGSFRVKRPFVLSRSFYVGSQRYGAIWTGDNRATWEHLQSSIRMLLSLSMSGLPFVGADVGGFFGNPSGALLTRWYQTALWTPFMRAHAHLETERREPYLLAEPYRTMVRASIRERYRILPYMYTLMWESHHSVADVCFQGMVMRPMIAEWPHIADLSGEEEQFMLGPHILHKPVIHNVLTEDQLPDVQVRLPLKRANGSEERWYHWHTGQPISLTGNDNQVVQETTFPSIPLQLSVTLVRGGAIVPVRDFLVGSGRRSSAQMRRDPLGLVIALGANRSAQGRLVVDSEYLDDQESGRTEQDHYALVDFYFDAQSGKLRLSVQGPLGKDRGDHHRDKEARDAIRLDHILLFSNELDRRGLYKLGTPIDVMTAATYQILDNAPKAEALYMG